jgi:D-alanyl-D-alanine carboxypeptidase (penicillin-binding protein 5/6)
VIKGDETGTSVGSIPVQKGKADSVEAHVKEQISKVTKKGGGEGLSSEVLFDPYLTAPVKAGTKCGEIVYSFNGEVIGRSELITAADVERASLFDTIRKIKDLLAG